MAKVSMLGCGGWGSAVAIMLARAGHDVKLWSFFPEEIEVLKRDREHKKLLPGIVFPENIELTDSLDCLDGCEFLVIAVPSVGMRKVCEKIRGLVGGDTIVVNISKGLEQGTLYRMSEVIKEVLSPKKFAVLCGPSHAEEVARSVPTACVVSSDDIEVAKTVQETFMNPHFRLYTSDDMAGAEYGAALKNVIALCAGICDGMGYGDNTKAALMTRGIAEMARLGVALGAKVETFSGLTGIGDLIVTCTSMHSRNRRAGILIGQGYSAKEAIEKVNMVVEGYTTAKAAYDLGKKADVELPITNAAYNVLYEGADPKVVIDDLMRRPKKHEVEELYLK
ncbi:MAG: NAD(P)H-dependent glycerol-3-phosphate dehydrogenase [Clostridia bacterium]|nr:NAD(P)H-dependent glycerol-3-phosphate dehydrogenase [Clostridia bacterium]